MLNLIWNNFVGTISNTGRSGVKRISRNVGRWDVASEALEVRQMLSATNAVEPVAIESAQAKTPVVIANVAGTWDVTTPGLPGTTSAVITQKGNKVHYTNTIPGVGNVDISGHFTKHSPNSFKGKTTVNVDQLGKVKVAYVITFGEGSDPTTFSAQTTATSKSLPQPLQTTLTGTKQGPITLGLALDQMAPTTLPVISGAWDLTITTGGLAVPADLTFTQSGKHVTGTVQYCPTFCRHVGLWSILGGK